MPQLLTHAVGLTGYRRLFVTRARLLSPRSERAGKRAKPRHGFARKEHMAMADHHLIGTWRLVSWENQTADGQITFPVGRALQGYIIYTADGYVAVQIATARRQPFAADDLLRGSTEEKVRAPETFIAYSSRTRSRPIG